MKADVQLATWNGVRGILQAPATSGTMARSGPKKRPMKMPDQPHFLKKAWPRGIRSGWRDRGQVRAICSWKCHPSQ